MIAQAQPGACELCHGNPEQREEALRRDLRFSFGSLNLDRIEKG